MNKLKRLALFDSLASVIHNPKTELKYSTHFELLIAVVLSAQSTDKIVNKATATLFSIANTPHAILALGATGLREKIKTIGLYNNKGANIIKLCQRLLAKHGDIVPKTRLELEALAGVGRKTANVMLNTAFGEPTIAVDTHVFRVANRTGLAKGKNVLNVEQKLAKIVPQKHKINAHHLLILHGRYTCISRKPKCFDCVIEGLCEFKNKTLN